MEIEKTGCGCTQCHTEVPTTQPIEQQNKVKPADVAGGIFLCMVMLVGVLCLFFYLEDDGE